MVSLTPSVVKKLSACLFPDELDGFSGRVDTEPEQRTRKQNCILSGPYFQSTNALADAKKYPIRFFIRPKPDVPHLNNPIIQKFNKRNLVAREAIECGRILSRTGGLYHEEAGQE